MERLVIYLVFQLLFTNSSYGSDSLNGDHRAEIAALVRAGKTRSRDARKGVSHEFYLLLPTFGAICNSDYGVFNYGFYGGFYLTPDLILGLSAKWGVPYRASHGTLLDISSGGTTEGYGAEIQYFVGNSFFGRLGLESRHLRSAIRMDGRERDSLGSYTVYNEVGRIHLNDIGLSVAIGNHWLLGEHFLIGADWASLFIPLITTHLDAKSDSSKWDEYVDAKSTEIRRGSVVYAPRLNLGFAF